MHTAERIAKAKAGHSVWKNGVSAAVEALLDSPGADVLKLGCTGQTGSIHLLAGSVATWLCTLDAMPSMLVPELTSALVATLMTTHVLMLALPTGSWWQLTGPRVGTAAWVRALRAEALFQNQVATSPAPVQVTVHRAAGTGVQYAVSALDKPVPRTHWYCCQVGVSTLFPPDHELYGLRISRRDGRATPATSTTPLSTFPQPADSVAVSASSALLAPARPMPPTQPHVFAHTKRAAVLIAQAIWAPQLQQRSALHRTARADTLAPLGKLPRYRPWFERCVGICADMMHAVKKLHCERLLAKHAAPPVTAQAIRQAWAQSAGTVDVRTWALPKNAGSTWLCAVLHALLPPTIIAHGPTRRQLLSLAVQYIVAPRATAFTARSVMCGIPVQRFVWAWPRVLRGKGVGQPQDLAWATSLVRAWLVWLLVHVVSPAVRSHFYITDAHGVTGAPLWFRASTWAAIRAEAAAQAQRKLALAPSGMAAAPRTLGTAKLRFLPKRAGVRHVANMARGMVVARAAPTRTAGSDWYTGLQALPANIQQAVNLSGSGAGRGRRASSLALNALLNDTLLLLRHVVRQVPSMLGAAVAGRDGIHLSLRAALHWLRSQAARRAAPLYIVTADVEAAYDSIQQSAALACSLPVLGVPAAAVASLASHVAASRQHGAAAAEADFLALAQPVGVSLPPAMPSWQVYSWGRVDGRDTLRRQSCLPLRKQHTSIASAPVLKSDHACGFAMMRHVAAVSPARQVLSLHTASVHISPATCAARAVQAVLGHTLVLPGRGTAGAGVAAAGSTVGEKRKRAAAQPTGPAVFLQRVGLAQGSTLSPMLCSLTIAGFERTRLLPQLQAVANEQAQPEPQLRTLLRMMDDYLMITTCKRTAQQLGRVLAEEHGLTGVRAHAGKSRLLELPVPSPEQCTAPGVSMPWHGPGVGWAWCGLQLWLPSTWAFICVRPDMRRALEHGPQLVPTPARARLVAACRLRWSSPRESAARADLQAALVQLLAAWLRPRLHPMFFDEGMQPLAAVAWNVWTLGALMAAKLAALCSECAPLAAQFRGQAGTAAFAGLARQASNILWRSLPRRAHVLPELQSPPLHSVTVLGSVPLVYHGDWHACRTPVHSQEASSNSVPWVSEQAMDAAQAASVHAGLGSARLARRAVGVRCSLSWPEVLRLLCHGFAVGALYAGKCHALYRGALALWRRFEQHVRLSAAGQCAWCAAREGQAQPAHCRTCVLVAAAWDAAWECASWRKGVQE